MNFKVIQTKKRSSLMSLKVSILIKEVAQYEHITSVHSLADRINSDLEKLQIKGSYTQPKNAFKAFIENDYTLHVWKMDSKGDRDFLYFIIYN